MTGERRKRKQYDRTILEIDIWTHPKDSESTIADRVGCSLKAVRRMRWEMRVWQRVQERMESMGTGKPTTQGARAHLAENVVELRRRYPTVRDLDADLLVWVRHEIRVIEWQLADHGHTLARSCCDSP